MSFAGEWILAVHKAIWFPLLWATGMEAAAAEDDWFALRDPAREAVPRGAAVQMRTPRTMVRAAKPIVRRRAA